MTPQLALYYEVHATSEALIVAVRQPVAKSQSDSACSYYSTVHLDECRLHCLLATQIFFGISNFSLFQSYADLHSRSP